MKTLPKTMAAFALALFGVLASGAAMAQHRGHGHGYGGARLGIYLGVPMYGAGYYPPYYYSPYYASPYYYPPAVVSAAPPVYVEQRPVQAAPQAAQGDWYYCAASKSYYPYVSECVSGWQRVPAQPPSR